MIDACAALKLMSSTSSRTGKGVVVAVCSEAGRIRPTGAVSALTAITSYIVGAPVSAELPAMMTRLESCEYDITQKRRVGSSMFAGIGTANCCIRTGGPADGAKTATDGLTGTPTVLLFPRTVNERPLRCQAIVRGRPILDGVIFAR